MTTRAEVEKIRQRIAEAKAARKARRTNGQTNGMRYRGHGLKVLRAIVPQMRGARTTRSAS